MTEKGEILHFNYFYGTLRSSKKTEYTLFTRKFIDSKG